MKGIILFITCLFFIPLLNFAQTQNQWGAFNQRIDAKPFAGKKFKLEAAVKVELIDSSSQAEIWVRVDKLNKKTGFFYNMMDKPIRSKEWKVYAIEGKIDKDADYFAFGGLFNKKGIFFFDDFKLLIETSKEKFEEIRIANSDFESDSLAEHWHYSKQQTDFFFSLTESGSYSGKQACKVDGSKLIKANTFGNNDSTGKYAFVNGIKLYYEIYGQGNPLLLLHGNSESIKSFRLQIPEFSKYYKVIAVDTRGQGNSSEDNKTYTYDLFAEDMNAFLNYLQLDSVNVLGWSDGGNIGLIMAMKYPEKVSHLITMGANVFIDNSVVNKSVFKELNTQLKELRSDSTSWSKNRVRLINPLLTEPRYKFEDLKVIHCPVLVLAGEKDVIKEEHTKKIAANISKSTLLIAPNETHYYPSENFNSFNKSVLDFLNNN